MTVQLFCGDCLEIMPTIAEKSVDAVICDPPYGTTSCAWDSAIPLEPMWEQLKRIIKPSGAIVLFGSQPFTSALVMSNIKMFRYCWVWDKALSTGFLNAKKMPLRQTEDICIFYRSLPTFKPQMIMRGKIRCKNTSHGRDSDVYRKGLISIPKFNNIYYPTTLLRISNASRGGDKIHPTQKPVALMEYLIKTYTNEDETVLDFTAGSGTTGVACVNTNRSFIGIEKDPQYFEIAKERIAEAERRKNNEFFVKKPTAPTLFDFMLEDKQ